MSGLLIMRYDAQDTYHQVKVTAFNDLLYTDVFEFLCSFLPDI